MQVLALYDGDPESGPWAEIIYLDDGAKAKATSVQITVKDSEKLHTRKDWRQPSTSLFMLKSFARTWLESVRVWAERLGDMSAADADAEAVAQFDWLTPLDQSEVGKLATQMVLPPRDLRVGYAALWNSINSKNPWRPDLWVWAVEWKLIPPEAKV